MLNTLDRQSIKLLWRLRRQLSREFNVNISLADDSILEDLEDYAMKSRDQDSRNCWKVLYRMLGENNRMSIVDTQSHQLLPY